MPASHSSPMGGGNFESESVATLSEWVADLSGIHRQIRQMRSK